VDYFFGIDVINPSSPNISKKAQGKPEAIKNKIVYVNGTTP